MTDTKWDVVLRHDSEEPLFKLPQEEIDARFAEITGWPSPVATDYMISVTIIGVHADTAEEAIAKAMTFWPMFLERNSLPRCVPNNNSATLRT